jgi:autotransporter-associated beta strand protein
MPTILKLQGQIKIQGASYAVPSIYWNGLGSDNNWSTSNNWNLLTTPTTNNILHFAGSTRTTPNNNLTVDTTINSIYFDSGAAAFTLSGNRFILGSTPFRENSIRNNSSNIQTINNDIILGSNAGNINCNTATINLNRNISGTGNLTKLGASSLSLSGNNTYTGDTFINSGFVSVFNSNPFGTGSVYLQTTAQWPILVQPTAAPATVVINNPIYSSYVAGPNTLSLINVGKSTTFNGPITFLTSGPVNQNVNFAFGAPSITLTFNGGISGTPTWWRSTLVNINGGTNTTVILSSSPVIFNNAVNFGFISVTTAIIAVSGNRFQTIRNIGSNIRCDVPFAINDDNITFGGGSESINLNGNSQIFRSINNGLTGCNIFNNSSTVANLTINPKNAENSIYSGSISGNINLIKTNQFSTLTLSGIPALNIGPRYTGFTAISGGILRVHALSSNPSDKVNYVVFQPTTLTVNFRTPPSIGDSFILLPGRTINSYPAVSLQNVLSGTTASYNSTTSTLSVIS